MIAKKDTDGQDVSIFDREMVGVRPLPASDKLLLRQDDPMPSLDLRRQAAVRESLVDGNPLATEHVELLDPHDELSFRRDGVQWGVFKKLRNGQYVIDGRLDLHRMTIEQARVEVFNFIRESRQYDLRTLLILHGKGLNSEGPKALLKSYTAKWLCQLEDVLAYHSAQKHHGGTGAVYVLLKKSERMKAENREKHGGRYG